MNARAPDSTKSAAAGVGARNKPVATNILAALTGSASGGMTIALDALGETYMRIAAEQGHKSRIDAPGGRNWLRYPRQLAA